MSQSYFFHVLGSIVVSIPACHAGDPGSIPGRGGFFFFAVLELKYQQCVFQSIILYVLKSFVNPIIFLNWKFLN
jgi:hypothetical protein